MFFISQLFFTCRHANFTTKHPKPDLRLNSRLEHPNPHTIAKLLNQSCFETDFRLSKGVSAPWTESQHCRLTGSNASCYLNSTELKNGRESPSSRVSKQKQRDQRTALLLVSLLFQPAAKTGPHAIHAYYLGLFVCFS